MLGTMAPPSLFVVVVVGLVAGMLARGLVGRPASSFASLIAGLSGAVLGAGVASALGLPLNGIAALAAAALAGAAALLSVVSLVRRR